MEQTSVSALGEYLRRGRVWAATSKAAALFLLPVPLLVALLAALIAGDAGKAAFTSGAVACLWSGAVLVTKGLVAEARYFLAERPDPPALPLKLLSAVLTVAGVSFAALAAGHGAVLALIFALLGGLGHLALYGLDLRPTRINVSPAAGVDSAAVTLLLKQAHGRLRGIEAAARSIRVPEFRDRLSRITAIGRSILGEVERDPADASRARRFLNVYLESAERVTMEYARTHAQIRAQPLEQNFRRLLEDMETSFAEQHRRLVDRELLSLDVDIEVLNTRLKGEGLG